MSKNKRSKKSNDMRPIDYVAQDINSWWEEKYTFMKTTKIRTWKALLIVAFFAGFLSALYWAASVSLYQMSLAAGETATLSLYPSVIEVTEQETFDLDVLLDTDGSDVVVARAIINYNKDYFELVSYDTSNSIFTVGNPCVMENGHTCEIIGNDPDNGTISITMAKPSPGVSTDSGVVAELVFRALQPISNSTDGIRLAYTSGSYEDSDVILDDGEGTDILVSAAGTTINVLEIDTTAPVLAEVTPVSSPSNDSTPNYSFSSTEAGAITYGGSCSSATTNATIGTNTVTFNRLNTGTYSDCTIVVTDAAGNPSNTLAVSDFEVDATASSVRADVNESGGITTADAQLILRYSAGLSMNGTAWVTSANVGDVNCDGNTTTADALLTLRYSAGLDMSGTAWCISD